MKQKGEVFDGCFSEDVIHHKIYACMHIWANWLLPKIGRLCYTVGLSDLFVRLCILSWLYMGCNKKCSTHERRDLEGFVFLSGDMQSDGSSDENGERVCGGGGRLEEEEEERKMLKRRISCHPLYGFLVEAHLDCLKVGLGSNNGKPGRSHKSDEKTRHYQPSLSMYSQSELDHFMEAYCTTLTKLKEAMEEPQQETLAFIDSMQSQLEELSGSQHEPPQPPTISSGERTE